MLNQSATKISLKDSRSPAAINNGTKAIERMRTVSQTRWQMKPSPNEAAGQHWKGDQAQKGHRDDGQVPGGEQRSDIAHGAALKDL